MTSCRDLLSTLLSSILNLCTESGAFDQYHTRDMPSKLRSRNRPNYAFKEHPRQLTLEDLAFIAQYTDRPAEALRSNTLEVWHRAKS